MPGSTGEQPGRLQRWPSRTGDHPVERRRPGPLTFPRRAPGASPWRIGPGLPASRWPSPRALCPPLHRARRPRLPVIADHAAVYEAKTDGGVPLWSSDRGPEHLEMPLRASYDMHRACAVVVAVVDHHGTSRREGRVELGVVSGLHRCWRAYRYGRYQPALGRPGSAAKIAAPTRRRPSTARQKTQHQYPVAERRVMGAEPPAQAPKTIGQLPFDDAFPWQSAELAMISTSMTA